MSPEIKEETLASQATMDSGAEWSVSLWTRVILPTAHLPSNI